MPELPEVETIVRELRRKISGKKLTRLSIFDRKIKPFRLDLPLKIFSVDRHGKYIVFHTDSGKILLHLRMSGRLGFFKNGETEKAHKSERAMFLFADGSVLRFFDPRRFGTLEWFDAARRKRGNKELPELGMNPFGPEFSADNFKKAVFSRSRGIKNLLLDQKTISGLGNIYADEALWFAKINPLRKSDSLSEKEALLLRKSIVKVLREAVKRGGFTMRDYRKTGGEAGSYQLFRKVYGREGLLCFRCGGTIRRIKIGARSARLCPKCQK